ncbi:MAG: AAA family ATPase [bacterium]
MIQLPYDISKSEDGGRLPVKPSEIHRELDERIEGLCEAKRFISTRIALHMKRALELAKFETPSDKNQCILIMGPSGSGKTFLIEHAANIVKLPFVAANSASLTEEGYHGQGLSSILNTLIRKTENRKLASYGICFLDEWDKRVHQRHERSGFSEGVQAEILRMMEGTMVEIEIRHSKKPPIKFNTKGLMFVFAGAFEGLNINAAMNRGGIAGFSPDGAGNVQRPSHDYALRDALVEYGMLPEFINRLTGILTLPVPTMENMLSLIHFKNGPLETCNKSLRKLGAELVVDQGATQVLAKYACETRSFSRGVLVLLQAAMDHLVYEGIKGQVALDAGDVHGLIAGRPSTLATYATASDAVSAVAGPIFEGEERNSNAQ